MSEFTLNGIHKPTAETFYLVMKVFAGLDEETINQIMDTVSFGGPID